MYFGEWRPSELFGIAEGGRVSPEAFNVLMTTAVLVVATALVLWAGRVIYRHRTTVAGWIIRAIVRVLVSEAARRLLRWLALAVLGGVAALQDPPKAAAALAAMLF